jgi:hypothetical protein
VRDKLFNTADRIAGTGSLWTRGRINAAAAVGGRVDLAVGKPATQSSTYGGADAGRAVDGNTSGLRSFGSIAHTTSTAQAWWQVDLQSSRFVDRIDIWNRTDCCGERLTNFTVSTSTNGTTWPSSSTVTVAGQAGRPTSVAIGRNARFVVVKLKGTNYLGLAEVQVWSR